MSLHKSLSGKFSFVAHGASDGSDVKAQFDAVLKALMNSYASILPAPILGVKQSPGALKDGEELSFPVVLTFEERAGDNLIGSVERKLKALFRRFVDAASAMPGAVGAVANIIGALDGLLKNDSKAVEVADARSLALESRGLLEWDRVSKLFKKWGSGAFKSLNLIEVDSKNWDDFLHKLQTSGTSAGGPAPAPATAPPAPLPAAPFMLTQLMGWLTKRSDNAGRVEYGFSLEGMCRFPDNAVQYGAWARLDVLGPDGSQLLTRRITSNMLAVWLYGNGSDDLLVEISPTRELRAALATPETPRQDVSTVSGRLWFSDGRPFGIRTLAVYVKPAISRLIDDCCPPEELEFNECCGESEVNVPILEVPQALAVAQTDQAGYFKFTYANSHPLASRFALIQVSGLAMPLALELRNGSVSEEKAYTFPVPVLLQVDSSLVIPNDGGGRVQWVDNSDDDCACEGLDFGDPNRTIDEFKADIVVRTTDPMIVRARIPVDGDRPHRVVAGQEAEGSVDGLTERSFRAVLSRDTQVEWDSQPMIAQAVTISHGRILTISQVWRADGYSLGDLRYSLPLAPLQKKNIAVIDWDRSDRSTMESTQDYEETLNNFVGRERDVSEIVNSALNESTSGHSESGGKSRSGGFGFSLGPVGFGGGSGGSAGAWSNSSQTSARTLAASFINKLRDQTVQAANALRAQRITMVQQVNQTESARAVTETVANRNACHAITVQYFEVLRHFRVDYELSAVRECLFIPLPISAFDVDKAQRWQQAIEGYLPSGFRSAMEALTAGLARPEDPKETFADEIVSTLSVTIDVLLDFPLPPGKLEDDTGWNEFLRTDVKPSSPLPQLINNLKLLKEDRAKFFEEKIAPVLARRYVESMTLTCGGADVLDLKMVPQLVSRYKAGEVHTIRFTETTPIEDMKVKRSSLATVKVACGVTAPDFDTVLFDSGTFRFSTEHLSGEMSAVAKVTGDGLGKPEATFSLPLRLYEKTNRKADFDRERARLLAHLNGNLEFYHKAIWWTMDANRRFELLDGFIAPNAGGRSVASVVENRLVAIIGNCIVMPVAPGVRLDYFDEVSSGGADLNDKDEDWLLARYRPLIPNPSSRIAVPTRGVFAESVMGKCNGCEKVDNSRNWQYWEHLLPDEPTAIEPVSLASRAKDAPVVQPPPMPGATVINQVAGGIPQAPDPVGLSAAIAAITNGGAFRDMAGLAGTQQNSRDALTQSYATTAKFGELGAELSKKQIDTLNNAMKMIASIYTGVPIPMGSTSDSGSESVAKSIAMAAAKGHITTQQAQDLTADLHRKMVDRVGGSEEQSLPNVPEVRDAIRRGGEEGAPVSVSRGDTRVDIGAPTRRAKGLSALGSLWTMRGKDVATRIRKEALPKLKIEIVTAIRPVRGAYQVGEKSRQVLLLDCEKRVLIPLSVTLGDTRIGPIALKAVRNKFTFDLYDSSSERFSMFIQGQTASGVRFMPDIDYRLNISIDVRNRRIRLAGAHDGFPSYSIFVDGKLIYDYEQNIFVEAVVGLMGTSDVVVDREVGY